MTGLSGIAAGQRQFRVCPVGWILMASTSLFWVERGAAPPCKSTVPKIEEWMMWISHY